MQIIETHQMIPGGAIPELIKSGQHDPQPTLHSDLFLLRKEANKQHGQFLVIFLINIPAASGRGILMNCPKSEISSQCYI